MNVAWGNRMDYIKRTLRKTIYALEVSHVNITEMQEYQQFTVPRLFSDIFCNTVSKILSFRALSTSIAIHATPTWEGNRWNWVWVGWDFRCTHKSFLWEWNTDYVQISFSLRLNDGKRLFVDKTGMQTAAVVYKVNQSFSFFSQLSWPHVLKMMTLVKKHKGK